MKKNTKIILRQAQDDAEQSRSITKEMKISEVVQKYPKTASVFIDYGLHCIGCPMAAGESSETIEQASKVHHIDLKKFLGDLNNAVE